MRDNFLQDELMPYANMKVRKDAISSVKVFLGNTTIHTSFHTMDRTSI